MYKIVFLFVLALHVNAAESFKELRYIYSLDKTIEYEGEISFNTNSIDINYTKPQIQSISYTEDEEDIVKQSFYLILKSIYQDNISLLEEFFELRVEGDKTLLYPHEMLSDFIQKVEYKKVKEHLEFLYIFLQNSDRIEIESY